MEYKKNKSVMACGIMALHMMSSVSMYGKKIEQEKEDGRPLEACRSLVALLSAEQGDNLSPAVAACQQKLAKSKRVPKEFNDVLPELCDYIAVMQNRANEHADQANIKVSVLTGIKDMIAQLHMVLDSSGTEMRDGTPQSAILSVPCDSQSIKQVLCMLDAKVDLILDALATCNDNNESIADVLGELNQISNEVVSVADIDAKMLTVIEWLKTISRQILEMQDADCWASCMDRCWP